MMRRILRIVLGVVGFPGALFLSAGRLDWPEARAFLSLFFVSAIILWAWIYRHDRALMRERLSSGPNVGKWDRVLMGVGWSGPTVALALVWWALAYRLVPGIW